MGRPMRSSRKGQGETVSPAIGMRAGVLEKRLKRDGNGRRSKEAISVVETLEAASRTKPAAGKLPLSKAPETIIIPAIKIERFEIVLVGDSPYICHAWSSKAIGMIKSKQAKEATHGREIRNPAQEYESCFYKTRDGNYGMPASALKLAAVDACAHVSTLAKTVARGAFHVIGDIVPIVGTPRMREDMVRVGMGSADIRYRAEFEKWAVRVAIRYNAHMLSPQQIINLFNIAGFSIGVGDWRTQKDGNHGMFHVGTGEEDV